jgi:hypothetical protein
MKEQPIYAFQSIQFLIETNISHASGAVKTKCEASGWRIGLGSERTLGFAYSRR